MRIDTTEMATVEIDVDDASRARKREGGGPEDCPLSVLLVDDNVEVREMIAAALEESGCVVFQAHGPKHARELLDGRPFDAAVLDLVMPNVHGLTVLEELRGLKFGKELPAVVLSVLPEGGARESARGRIERAGHAEMLDKPVTRSSLISALRRLVPAKA